MISFHSSACLNNTCHIFFMHSVTARLLGWFIDYGWMNSDIISIALQVSLVYDDFDSFSYTPGTGGSGEQMHPCMNEHSWREHSHVEDADISDLWEWQGFTQARVGEWQGLPLIPVWMPTSCRKLHPSRLKSETTSLQRPPTKTG